MVRKRATQDRIPKSRRRIISLYEKGVKIRNICTIVGVSKTTVFNWLLRCKHIRKRSCLFKRRRNVPLPTDVQEFANHLSENPSDDSKEIPKALILSCSNLKPQTEIDCEEINPLRCWDCNINFTNKNHLNTHLLHHIKQPQVLLERVQLPPLRITLKNRHDNSFEIVNSPSQNSPYSENTNDPYDTHENIDDHRKVMPEEDYIEHTELEQEDVYEETDKDVGEEEAYVEGEEEDVENSAITEEVYESQETEQTDEQKDDVVIGETGDGEEEDEIEEEIVEKDNTEIDNNHEYGSIPGGEPTPPPEPSPDYPRIRIKTTGLLKDPDTNKASTGDAPSWTRQKSSKPDNNLLSLFNNNERAKDLGFTTSDPDIIPIESLEERPSRNSLQLYNSTSQSNNPLSNLPGLPMEALAQQVSRLQQTNGMHQQNVLINIQQFPQAPPPHPPPFQPPPIFHHPPQPMYQHYQYQPPSPLYYPPGYPPQHMPPPPRPPMTQSHGPTTSQHGQPSRPQYRQTMPPRPTVANTAQRASLMARQPSLNIRQPMARPRTSVPMQGQMVRGIRPRILQTQSNQRMPMKRPIVPPQIVQTKRKRCDMLTPEKDDEDCQVICMQPKNTDGLPQIESVQGGTVETTENNVMHLSDSITLSVRNPQPPSPKKSDAKAVANILATRGITVTATPKPKEKSEAQKCQTLAASLNLNGAVSIIPSNKQNGQMKNQENSGVRTVDLTEDHVPPPPPPKTVAPAQKTAVRKSFPFKCDLCPAHYPNPTLLSKHRQNFHKTVGGSCDIGVPVVNLKQPGIFQKMSSMGIVNYIPLPTVNGMFALPLISARNPGNIDAIGATTMLPLGPIRIIPRVSSSNAATKSNASAK